MADAGVKPSEISEVILVGGMTRMPKVQEKLKKFSEKNRTKALTRMKSLPSALQFRAVF